MCLSSGPDYKPPPKPPATPRMADEGAQRARQDDKRRQRVAAGRSSTIKTQGDLLGDASTTGNLLGN